LDGDILNRVRRLPKPSQASEALQPLFEAISNSLHAVEDAHRAQYQELGRIIVTIVSIKTPKSVQITVADNGIGLDDERFRAFCTTDTDYKVGRGGKGIGRLLWLDAFEGIKVESVFLEKSKLKRRTFSFRLAARDQIVEETIKSLGAEHAPTGTTVTFSGLRDNAYRAKFPTQPATLVKTSGRIFLPTSYLERRPRSFSTLMVTLPLSPKPLRKCA
jgi:DNA topoisomerase VI subunit B